MPYLPKIPVSTDSGATSQGQISGNFTQIDAVLGSSTLHNGLTKTTGDIFYASNSNTISVLASAASTRFLQGGSAPSWAQPDLSTDITGTLPIANGGTGSTATTYCDMASNVYGTLPVVRGGTGTTNSNAANGVVILGADGYLPDESCDTSALKTTTGEVSHTGSTFSTEAAPGGEYGFLPMVKMSDTTSTVWGVTVVADGTAGGNNDQAGWTTYAAKISLVLGNTSKTLYAQQRYVTASGIDHWVFVKIDKRTGKILSVYQAPDHPCYGNGGNPNKLPHPFISYNHKTEKIVILDKEIVSHLKKQKTQDRSMATLINEDYRVNQTSSYKYYPLHSGLFLGNAPVMIKHIPEYIEVKSLKSLTQEEKNNKREEERIMTERINKNRDIVRNNAFKKLQKLGLTKEEILALRQ